MNDLIRSMRTVTACEEHVIQEFCGDCVNPSEHQFAIHWVDCCEDCLKNLMAYLGGQAAEIVAKRLESVWDAATETCTDIGDEVRRAFGSRVDDHV